MIFAVANTKGGVGKTTLAVNLAIVRALQGRDVLLVDADTQGTALSFTDLRTAQLGTPGYTAVALRADAVLSQVKRMAPKYHDVVIDVGGRDTKALRAAMVVANRVLVPVQPRSFDVWAVEHMADLIGEARSVNGELEALCVLALADPIGSDNAEAAAVLKSLDSMRYLDRPICRRKAFPNAASCGRAVVERQPRDPKAIAELEALAGAVFH